jgi:hypothetical protein
MSERRMRVAETELFSRLRKPWVNFRNLRFLAGENALGQGLRNGIGAMGKFDFRHR